MGPSRTRLILGLLLGMVFGFYIARKSTPVPPEPPRQHKPIQVDNPEVANGAGAGASAPSAPRAAHDKAEVHDAELQSWISTEAKQMDTPSSLVAGKQHELALRAARLTPPQSRQLLETVLSAAAPANEKILSTYLLVLGGATTAEAVRELITAPLADSGPQPPHSEAEARNMREKALRVMAVDGLAERAREDASARDLLERTIRDIRDPYVKAHTQRRIDELHGH